MAQKAPNPSEVLTAASCQDNVRKGAKGAFEGQFYERRIVILGRYYVVNTKTLKKMIS